ncbi:Os03g0808900 [Oryza sativa Japonica Group]|uniref:Os03g0808900 protein n=1 Tax=Oryza sativa subsp. japonica TaxID=39947 RepID=C7J033_ORYSJ|nr:Os03g0808900 [Oryza sativa Japonica Group]|eukprot:NP_001173682.1 Os03g0808900 [Oryza sativa Japonica Group]
MGRLLHRRHRRWRQARPPKLGGRRHAAAVLDHRRRVAADRQREQGGCRQCRRPRRRPVREQVDRDQGEHQVPEDDDDGNGGWRRDGGVGGGAEGVGGGGEEGARGEVRVRVARHGGVLGRREAGGGGDGALRERGGVPGAVAGGDGEPAGHRHGLPLRARPRPRPPAHGARLLRRAPRLPGVVRRRRRQGGRAEHHRDARRRARRPRVAHARVPPRAGGVRGAQLPRQRLHLLHVPQHRHALQRQADRRRARLRRLLPSRPGVAHHPHLLRRLQHPLPRRVHAARLGHVPRIRFVAIAAQSTALFLNPR